MGRSPTQKQQRETENMKLASYNLLGHTASNISSTPIHQQLNGQPVKKASPKQMLSPLGYRYYPKFQDMVRAQAKVLTLLGFGSYTYYGENTQDKQAVEWSDDESRHLVFYGSERITANYEEWSDHFNEYLPTRWTLRLDTKLVVRDALLIERLYSERKAQLHLRPHDARIVGQAIFLNQFYRGYGFRFIASDNEKGTSIWHGRHNQLATVTGINEVTLVDPRYAGLKGALEATKKSLEKYVNTNNFSVSNLFTHHAGALMTAPFSLGIYDFEIARNEDVYTLNYTMGDDDEIYVIWELVRGEWDYQVLTSQ